MPASNGKWCITTKKTLKPDTIRNFLLHMFDTFPEKQVKLLANSFMGELGRKYMRTDHGFACRSMDTVQCIWTSAHSKGRDIFIDNYKDLVLVRERKIERNFSDNTSINRFIISQAILRCLNLIYDNWTNQ